MNTYLATFVSKLTLNHALSTIKSNFSKTIFQINEKDDILIPSSHYSYLDQSSLSQSSYPATQSIQLEEPESMEDLYNFMYWGDYDKAIQTLADMAIPENWEYPEKRENYILKNYLKYTFLKLQDENKVFSNNDYVLFNTGLFTSLYDPIYIYGEKNRNQSNKNYSEWIFKDFMTEYDLGEIGIYELPQRADYFSDPSQLIFDPTLKINVQYDHILKDARNIERIQNIDSRNIQSLLIGEIDKAKKRVAANYQLAVPQYFQNKIQLLLPLCLEDGVTPDIALVVTKSKNGKYYQGHTCLTLDMAYNNARLIAKPENNWLTL